jgi:hypothetical protein
MQADGQAAGQAATTFTEVQLGLHLIKLSLVEGAKKSKIRIKVTTPCGFNFEQTVSLPVEFNQLVHTSAPSKVNY